jgi:hypothetical protein
VSCLLKHRKQKLALVSDMDGYCSYLREHNYLPVGTASEMRYKWTRSNTHLLPLVYAKQASIGSSGHSIDISRVGSLRVTASATPKICGI